jgi:hypothetical protein
MWVTRDRVQQIECGPLKIKDLKNGGAEGGRRTAISYSANIAHKLKSYREGRAAMCRKV